MERQGYVISAPGDGRRRRSLPPRVKPPVDLASTPARVLRYGSAIFLTIISAPSPLAR
jgi:hypothetical protein